MTGVLTIAMLGFIGFVLYSGGSTLWGAIAFSLAGLRAVLLGVQLVRVVRARREDDEA
jgi:hypothetical protein